MTITAWVAQQVRVLAAAARYREQIRREAEARARQQAAREAQERARALAEFEDDLARGLAEGNVYFPSDRDGGPGPRLLTLEQWRSHGNEDVWERKG
jgi:hypothetical protein